MEATAGSVDGGFHYVEAILRRRTYTVLSLAVCNDCSKLYPSSTLLLFVDVDRGSSRLLTAQRTA